MLLLVFFLGIVGLFLGYKFYSPYVLKQLKLDENMEMPSQKLQDGVDYMQIDPKRNMLIQLLNIAGTGPVFGPIMAALFGPIALVLIPLGNVFAGAVMDLGFGVVSLKNDGQNFPAIARKYMGGWSTWFTTIFSALLLLLVATVFVVTPASILSVTFFGGQHIPIIIGIIFAYYIMATVMPVDKIIARYYPYVTAILLLGTIAIFVSILLNTATGNIALPSLTAHGFVSWAHPNNVLLFPGFIVAVSCGFISGFHTTQSPIVAKTMGHAKHARKTFYGMMSVEGGIAMIWALASIVLFQPAGLLSTIQEGTASLVVHNVSTQTLGVLAPLVILAVVILPITSGDTAFRSLRSIFAEVLNVSQVKMSSRLIIALPLFGVSVFLTTIDFGALWAYFTWSNHMLSIMSLILLSGYLKNIGSNYFIALAPCIALFFLNMLYLFNDAAIGTGLAYEIAAVLSVIVVIISSALLLRFSKSWNGKQSFSVDT